ncbi:MAG: DNA mismatch repair protein MutS [Atopostipes suicloacalis]|nr:DNA mismatch repair protein MutS [Atopostipes suicloacalis]
MPQDTKQTPMMKQYFKIKNEYPEEFLFFRLGDFYELFYEDAIQVSQLLEITLTSRNKNAKEPIPMAGVPHHSAQSYIDRLIELGHKVAVCEQVEDPKEAKGMVKREVVQVITPGTVMQGDIVDEKENNYLAAILQKDGEFVLSYVDLTTGELKATKLASKAEVFSEIAALEVKEVLFFEGESTALQADLEKHFGTVFSYLNKENKFMAEETFDELTKAIENESLLAALSLLLHYLAKTQMRSLDHLQQAESYDTNHYLRQTSEVRRNLELTISLRDHTRKGTLLSVMDRTKTAMGGRLLKNWLDKPLVNRMEISKRQDLVENMLNHFFERTDLNEILTRVYDLERLAGRIAYGSVNARDLIQLKQSLEQIPMLIEVISLMNIDETWDEILRDLDPVSEVTELINHAIKEEPPILITEGEIIKDAFDKKLDQYRDAMTNGKQWLAELETKERQATGIGNLKIGFNKVFGYYIEITKGNLDKLEEGRYERKQTLANSERFITPELKEMESTILEAEEKSQALEHQLFIEVREEVKQEIKRIQRLAQLVAKVDVLQSFAQISEDNHYTRPDFHDDSRDVEIIEGRHPVVEDVMEDHEYVPNDVYLKDNVDILLITGPNMSGKSTYMRQVALIIIMAQMGCFVPATKVSLPIFDQIFARIGAMDDLISGQSTFMVEMTETNQAITNATANSLLLFDEIGRGTATYDGMALAEAVIEYVHDKIGAKTLFSTHYHELTALENRLDSLQNIHVGAVEEDGDLVFLYKVSPGSADKSYGIQVAKLAGLPKSLLSRATTILETLENKKKESINSFEENNGEEKSLDKINESDQLTLFNGAWSEEEEAVLKEIKRADIINLTPLEAMELLNELQNNIQNEK